VIDRCPAAAGLPGEDATQRRIPAHLVALILELHRQWHAVDEQKVMIVEIRLLQKCRSEIEFDADSLR